MRLPHVKDLHEVDVAVVGIPSDGAQVFRSGSRFGPEAIRSASVMLRNYNPILGRRRLRAPVARRLRGRAHGPRLDRRTPSSGRPPALGEVAAAGVVTLGLGGDHTVLLAELRLARCRPRSACPRAAGRPPRCLGRVLRPEALPRQRGPAGGGGGPRRRRHARCRPGMRGSLTAEADAALPAELGFRCAPVRGAGRARAGGLCPIVSEHGSATPRASCPSTSTSSTRRSRREPAPLNPAVLRAARPSPSSVRCTGAGLPRLRLRRGLAAVRPVRSDGLRRCERLLRDAVASGAFAPLSFSAADSGAAKPLSSSAICGLIGREGLCYRDTKHDPHGAFGILPRPRKRTSTSKGATLGQVIAFANQKGGVAKTTTTLNLAVAFKEKGFEVLAVDLDPQGNLTMISGHGPGSRSSARCTTSSSTRLPIEEDHPPGGDRRRRRRRSTLPAPELALSSMIGRERALREGAAPGARAATTTS